MGLGDVYKRQVLILAAVFLVVTLIVRDRVRATAIARLTVGQTMLSTLEQRRSQELQTQAETLAESPTVKAAMDTYLAESYVADVEVHRQLIRTVQREVDELADRIRPDIVAVLDSSGTVVAAAGRRRGDWPHMMPGGTAAADDFLVLPGGVFRVASAPLVVERTVGYLQLGFALDTEYATQLTSLSGAGTIIATPLSVVASTLPAARRGR